MKFILKNKKKIIDIAGKILTVLSLVFLVWSVKKTGIDLDMSTHPGRFIFIFFIGIVLKTISVFASAHGWSGFVSFFAKNAEKSSENKLNFKKRDAIRVYSKANIGKYLPGNVMHIIERNLYLSSVGIPQTDIALSSVFEIGAFLIGGFILAILGGCFPYYVTLAASGALVLLSIAGLFALRRFKPGFKKVSESPAFWKAAFICLFDDILAVVLLGIIMVLLHVSEDGFVTITEFFRIVSGYAASWVAGFVTPGAPGGIGVRELALTYFLGPVIGEKEILTLSITHRLITIIGDFVAYGIGVLCLRNKADCDKILTENNDLNDQEV